MAQLIHYWHRILHWSICRVFFDRVRVIEGELLPDLRDRPVLFVSLHRNGAMDGFLLRSLFPRMTFLISRNLRRGLFSRIFFCGIETVRDKDKHEGGPESRRETIQASLEACHRHLLENGQLGIFPEGTSSLGPRHLPFKSGAARIVHRFLEEQGDRPLVVVPLGLHYERAWAFRSRVEVLVGRPVSTEFSPDQSSRERLLELKKRLRDALEALGANFESAEAQEESEALAYAATVGTKANYADTLRRFAESSPSSLAEPWKDLDAAAEHAGLWRHQGVPLFPPKRWHLAVYVLLLIPLGAVVGLAALLNLPILSLAARTARKRADERNVVALIRSVSAFTVGPIWIALVGATLLLAGVPTLLAAYLALSVIGLLCTYRVKKLSVSVRNGLCASSFRRRALRFHESLLAHEHDEHHSERSANRLGTIAPAPR